MTAFVLFLLSKGDILDYIRNGSTDTYYYGAKDNAISKTKFKQQLKKLTKSRKLTKLKYHENTSANRKKYLS
jgi:hypothetical protein